MDAEQSPKTQFLLILESLYREKGESKSLEEERPIWEVLADELFDEKKGALKASEYRLEQGLGLGTTSVVLKVCDLSLKADRAFKVLRPCEARRDQGVRVARGESEKLAALDHPNIMRVYRAAELNCSISGLEYCFPYFFMTFINGLKDFHKLLDDFEKNLNEDPEGLSGDQVIEYIHQIASAICHLHARGIIHCDLKPENIFVAPKYGALVGDLGYAKYLRKEPSGTTPPIPTRWYAHPKLLKLIEGRTEIPREDLQEAFDLFAFGRTLLRIMYRLRQVEAKLDGSFFTSYQWSYLTIIAKRLLDGQRKSTEGKIPDESGSPELLPGMSDDAVREVAYSCADDALQDIQKLLHLFDLEGKVPELDPDIRAYIQIPHAKVPKTPRVEAIINHPCFSRLARVSQLGFVSLVYPGAAHSRFEHSLGTLARCCAYVRALWYDTENPLFQSIMNEREVGLVLLAALLHDLGQYPMAHDLAEVDRRFAHERFVEELVRFAPDGYFSLERVISDRWGYSTEEVLDVLAPGPSSTFRHRLLNALINGPFDCDKMDYLPRDSTHLGIVIGLSVDVDRLLRHLTVVKPPDWALHEIDVGVAEKVLSVAETVLSARDEMFRQVYWHHTIRVLKAMLAYSVRGVLLSRNASKAFWDAFDRFRLWCSPDGDSAAQAAPQATAEPTVLDDLAYSPFDWPIGPLLTASDDAVLSLLDSFAPSAARNMVRMIRSRQLYNRVITIRADLDKKDDYTNIYLWYKGRFFDGDHGRIEEQRLKWEEAILELVMRVPDNLSAQQRSQLSRTRELLALADEGKYQEAFASADYLPVILFDVPVKATSRREIKANVWYLEEAKFERPPTTKSREWDLGGEGFDKRVGKIRLLVHPNWKDAIQAGVTEEKLREAFHVT